MNGLRETAARLGSDLLVQGLPGAFNTTFGAGPVRDYRDYAATDRDRQRRFLRGAPGSRRAGDVARDVVPVGGARRRRHRADPRDCSRSARGPRLARGPSSDEDHPDRDDPARRHALRPVRPRPHRRGDHGHRRHVHDGRGARGLHPRARGAEAARQGSDPDPAPLDVALRQRRGAVRRPGHRGPGDLGHRRRALGHPRPGDRPADLPAARRGVARPGADLQHLRRAGIRAAAARGRTAGRASSRTCTPGTTRRRSSPRTCCPRASRP